MAEPMYITGYSLRAPSSNDPKEFYANLSESKDMTTPTRRYPEGYLGLPPRSGTLPEIDKFDQDFFHFSTKQTEKMDVAIRLLLEVTHEALLDAQLPVESLRGSRTGVYVGHCFSDFLNRSTNDPSLTGYELVNGAHTMAANKISYFYDFKGPSMAIDTACSSSLVALHMAQADLKAGLIDRAVVSGLSLTLDPRKNAIFNAFTMLSPTGECYSFDERANGYCRSEGVVTVVLEAARVCNPCRALAKLHGTSVNSDGYKEKGITFPSGQDQCANARIAFASAGVDPASIKFVEAHGTGTVAGDKQELDGLSRVFYGDAATGPEPGGQGDEAAGLREGGRAFSAIPLGSVKSAMGHAEGASGLMSVAKCLCMLERKVLLPNQRYATTKHAPILDGRFRVVTSLEPWEPGNVCISNYGFGGTNAFAVLGPAIDATTTSSIPQLQPPLLAGLPPQAALRFSNAPGPDATGGKPANKWFANQVALGNDKPFKCRGGKKVKPMAKVAFVYGGQGSQWPCMGQKLYRESPAFKACVDRLGTHLKEVDASLDLGALFEAGDKWMDKQYTVLGITAYQVAATQILASVGVVPDYYMGHSLGETAAGHARGLQSEKETILIAYVRAKLSGGIKAGGAILKTPQDRSQEPNFPSQLCVSKGNFYYEFASPQAATAAAGPSDQVFDLNGQMVAVGLPAAEIQAAIVELNLKETCVACFNGPAGQTVSGAAVEVALLKAKLASVHGESLFWREVDTDGVAYHAPHLNCYFDYLTGEFERILGDGSASAGAKARPLDQGWCTTSTPMPAYNSEDFLTHQKPMLDAEFHARNIVSPVYFQQAIESLPPGTLVVEVGSSQSLLGQVKRVRADIGLTGLVKRLEPTTETLLVHPLLAKAALWEAGYSPATTVAAAASAAAASSAIKGKNDAPQPLVAYAGAELGDDPLIPAPIKKSHSFEKAKPPAVPPAPGAFPTALVELPRPPFEERWPAGLWEHDREQRVFTHLDFELKIPNEGGDDAEGMGGATAVAYDLAGADAFLMDHRVNGRALFPATGHLYTMWHAKGLAQGLKLRDFEVLTAVVLDPANAPTLTFGVAEMGNTLAVLYQGAVVARATFEVLGEATPENAACAPRPELELEGSSDTVEGRLWVPRGQLYNHFKRYGYEYQEEFQLVTRRTVPARNPGGIGCGELRGACHVIPYLDNFLQLFLEDLSMLNLPTLIREAELLPGACDEALRGSRVKVETGCGTLESPNVRMRGLHTMPAAGPVHPPLLHRAHTFVPLGEQLRDDPPTAAAFDATRRYTACAITAHLKTQPEVLAEKPWLANVLKHASQWVEAQAKTAPGAPAVPSVNQALYQSSLHYRMHVDLYQDLPKLLDNTFLTLSLHPEHDALYEKNAVMASTDAELAELVGIVRKEWHGVDLDVWEGGSGSCGFTRRVVPLVEGQLAQYTCSDISAIRLGTLAGHPSIKSAKHDLNFPIEGATGKHHLVLANNAIHTAGNVKKTLAYFRDALTEGGFVLLEEQITDACLYLWGLDDFIWTTVDEDLDPRSYGLWMAWSEWLATIQATQGLELLAWHRSDYHVTMLLRKTSSPKPAAPVQASWSDVAALNAAAASNGDSQGAPTQVLRGAGADGLVKTLRLEEGNYALQALVDLDGSAAQANLSGESLALPLNFTHVQGGKAGSLVVVPAAAWQAGQAHKAAVAQARADVTAKPAAAAATSAVAAGGNVQLHIMRPGDLSTLAWIEAPATPEYQVSVAYSSLNFKDIMYAFGKLRLEKPSFGLEFSGTVGPDQSPVMGIGTSSCIALKTMPTLCWPVPDGMSLEAAATVPVVYATALFSLFEKARLEKGHTALIHAGTGGVGHAAIYLCQARGIEVFATCGDAKRQYLKDTFGLDDAHIGNSRDTSFREVVYRGTNGEGVDCVLNSLSGSLLDASLQCVKAYGHFCEIGKYDLQNNTPVGLKAFEANVSYHAIDLAAMFTHPRLSLVLQKLLADALAAGEVTPLPAAVYEASQVEAALRFMSAGKHRGKVLVRMSGFNPTTAVTAAPVEAFAASSSSSSLEAAAAAAPEVLPRFNTTGTHLITGGTGGFGMELAGWLMTHGAKKVVVTSRSGLTSGWQRYRADALEAQFGAGCLELSSLDVVNPQQCGELLTLCDGTGDKKGELKGVWHVAMVLQDVLFKNMTPEKWNTCNAVKVNGLENLDASCRQLLPSSQLDCFVAFSSVSSLFGNVGQANYAYANAACETVVLQRNAAGLKGVAVQWGMIDNVGFFGSHDAKVLETFLGFQNIDASMASLHELLPMGGVVTSYRLAATAKGGNDDGAAFELSVPTIQAKFAEILGGKAGDYDPEAALNDYGLDSLSSIEVVNWMNRHTTSSVNPSFMTADMTINKMHAFMAANSKSE